MATCDACGNDYHTPLEIQQGEKTGTFDSFECAIATMAPTCPTCGTRIIGHGTERDGIVYCCNNCAQQPA